ncbi:histidine--tRNA ligase [Aquella oligotrophica]|uniref:Histidine--tRNA ligase n=1 Tax=Aquella oligotrophica TaxID=2067065 RepID=A0A2I7N5M3_9NEIS|nr:histidine--tRNA ligase [Aquella oligotrophica]AUR51731.1 histidine--tRNA ligase [Aquella oligotrophica]
MGQKITGIKGMNDILPEQSKNWLWIEEELRNWLIKYGYNNIRTPILEDTALFVRSIGEVTDIVEKEMYSFTDSLNGDKLTLRPEGTAGTLRAVLEHSLLYNATQKLWYIGPMFRHERPQKGRYRQFHQLGVEALGFQGPDIDAEIIVMLNDLWHRLGLKNVELHINCLGNAEERLNHRNALIGYFENNQGLLDEEAKRRLHSNPLRILDTKNPNMQDLVTNAPRLIDYLGDQSLAHYNGWKNYLDNMQISYVENPRLVRGLDYYNLSVFEWISSDLGAQSTICGGGRYDPLIVELGGKDNYAIGFAIGIERLLMVLEANNKLPDENVTDIYVVNEGAGTDVAAFKIAHQLRSLGFKVIQNFGGGSFKSQFKKADNSKARVTLVLGENEVKSRQVVLKCMATQKQEVISTDNLSDIIVNYLIK